MTTETTTIKTTLIAKTSGCQLSVFFVFFLKGSLSTWFGIQGKQSGGLQHARQLSRHIPYLYSHFNITFSNKNIKNYTIKCYVYIIVDHTQLKVFSNLSSLFLLIFCVLDGGEVHAVCYCSLGYRSSKYADAIQNTTADESGMVYTRHYNMLNACLYFTIAPCQCHLYENIDFSKIILSKSPILSSPLDMTYWSLLS